MTPLQREAVATAEQRLRAAEEAERAVAIELDRARQRLREARSDLDALRAA